MKSTTLLEYWQCKTLDILKVFIRLCNENNLVYYTCGGTSLGSVRHGDFIPWDDDIDILMPRPDYERFLELYENANIEGYELITPRNRENYYLSYAKLCLKDSTIVEDKSFRQEIGLYIDIFPLDSCSDDYEIYMKDQLSYEKLRNKLYIVSSKYTFRGIMSLMYRMKFSTLYEIFISWFNRSRYRASVLSSMNKIFAKYQYGATLHVTSYASFWIGKEFHELQWFGVGIPGKIRDVEVINPLHCHDYLKQLYGNYMTLPPIESRITHHSFYYLNLSERITRANIK